MGVTIKDVARTTGVSIKTVSRVINDSPDVAVKTRQKVLDAITKLDYQPNAIARSLILRQTNTIGLCVGFDPYYVFTNPYFSEVFRGVNEACNKYNYNLLFRAKNEISVLNLLRSSQIDGLLYMSVKKDRDLTKELLSKNFPAVIMGLPDVNKDLPWVAVDVEKATKRAVEHLINSGNKKIGYIGGVYQYMSNIRRFETFKKTLSEANLPVFDQWIIHSNQITQEAGYLTMKKLLQSDSFPSAVFVFNDILAIGCLRALKEKGFKVPEDMGLIGFDDISLASYTDPPLTTIRHLNYEKGLFATEMLIKLIKGEQLEEKHILLESEIVVRKSC